MKEVNMDVFYTELKSLLNILKDKEKDNILKASKILYETTANGGMIQVLGTGHSIGFGMELRNRVGSLANVNQINTSDFVISGKVSLEEFNDKVNYFERRPYIADKLYDLQNVGKNDCFIIISNSGINGIVIDMALVAKKMGHKLIVITSMQHTLSEESRHPSGKKLYELADVVIDNCGPKGDALLETDVVEKVCSVSSITGAFIAQSLCIECIRLLKENNEFIPIYYDENLEGSQKHNELLKERYGGKIINARI